MKWLTWLWQAPPAYVSSAWLSDNLRTEQQRGQDHIWVLRQWPVRKLENEQVKP